MISQRPDTSYAAFSTGMSENFLIESEIFIPPRRIIKERPASVHTFVTQNGRDTAGMNVCFFEKKVKNNRCHRPYMQWVAPFP